MTMMTMGFIDVSNGVLFDKQGNRTMDKNVYMYE